MTLISLAESTGVRKRQLPVTHRLSVGPPDDQFLFGGVGLAAAITAMADCCGRPAVWATAQYLSYARPGSVLELDVTVPAEGRFSSQARVLGHVAGREVLTVNGALGRRPGDFSRQWMAPPEVAAPEDSPALTFPWARRADDVHSLFDTRVAAGPGTLPGPDSDGRVVLWARPLEGAAVDAAALAVIADFVPSVITHALGGQFIANSLDNTIRFRHVAATDWVLCDVSLHGIHGGFGHGRMLLYSRDGALMASASQSVMLRRRKGDA